VIWQFRSGVPEARERLALRGIAIPFFTLAAWISFDAIRSLIDRDEARPSGFGIGIAAASVVVMPLLVWAKRRTGRQLGSVIVAADSMQTILCTYLSVVVLAGLLLNTLFGWWWADPVAALIITAVAVREGIEAWRGEQCDDCALPSGAATDNCGCSPGCTETCCGPHANPTPN
jgi:divalent metal cation (Fe/Co/Zn/Cd) transporter